MSAPSIAPERAGSQRPGPEKRRRRLLGRHPIGLAFTAPYVVFWVAVFAYPLGLAIWMSFHEYFFTAPGFEAERPFLGLENYVTMLADEDVRRGALNVVIFLIINVPLTVALALVLATALNAAVPWRTFFRVGYFLPYVTASVAVIAVWLFLFNSNGLIPNLLGPLAPDPPFLINRNWAMPIIAFFATWKQLGWFVVLYLAALQNVPGELYEAAAVDGANRVQKFFAVTVPGVRPATTLVVILSVITGANFFTEPYLLTSGGGPNGASVSPVLIMYQEGIQQGDAGYAAAIGVTLAVVVASLSFTMRRVLERD